jgi:superfamily I DNA/RNA helicase
LQEVNDKEDEQDDDNDSIRLDRYGNVMIEDFANGEENIIPRGIERVVLGTFHSVCGKIMRYKGELLNDLPCVHRDMAKAGPIYATQETDDDDDTSEAPVLIGTPEISLNGQFAIIDQSKLNECLIDHISDQCTIKIV